jgi:hypothetical protein
MARPSYIFDEMIMIFFLNDLIGEFFFLIEDVNIEMVKEKLQKIYSQTEKYFTYIEPFTVSIDLVRFMDKHTINRKHLFGNMQDYNPP